jgi:hypothetical protein
MAISKFQQKLIDDGYCDEHGAGFCASATRLPNGEYGLIALCVKGNILSMYDVDMRNNIGACVYTVELSKIEGLKIKCNILSQILKFVYEGKEYAFTNFLGVKPALEVIKSESEK